MMSDGFRKVKISLVLRVVHICLIHPLNAQIFVYLMIYGRIAYIAFIILKVYQHVYNIHLKGTVSQNYFFIIIFLDFIK